MPNIQWYLKSIVDGDRKNDAKWWNSFHDNWVLFFTDHFHFGFLSEKKKRCWITSYHSSHQTALMSIVDLFIFFPGRVCPACYWTSHDKSHSATNQWIFTGLSYVYTTISNTAVWWVWIGELNFFTWKYWPVFCNGFYKKPFTILTLFFCVL